LEFICWIEGESEYLAGVLIDFGEKLRRGVTCDSPFVEAFVVRRLLLEALGLK
jgi:hypothetical protein